MLVPFVLVSHGEAGFQEGWRFLAERCEGGTGMRSALLGSEGTELVLLTLALLVYVQDVMLC